MELYQKTAAELSALLGAGEVSAAEVAAAAIARTKQVENTVDAFLSLDEERVLAAAREVDARRAAGEKLGALAGVPVAIKDNICTEGEKTTCASRMMENFMPIYDATVITKLKQQGAVPFGKVNMDEFAMGSSCETSYFKTTKNPWDTGRVPGGSSGGSAAAVAACEVPLALGTDTGGSIRLPASFCGVVGLKPTYGAVSRFGVVAFASSLEQVGPLARTVDDAALLFSAICGADKANDATSKEFAFDGSLGQSIKGLKVGLPKEYFGEGIQPQVLENVNKAVETLKSLGAEIVEISLPSTSYALSAFYIISSAEASSNLARFDGLKYGFSAGKGGSLTEVYETNRSEGFGAEVKRRIMLGTHVLSSGYYDAYYKRAKILQHNIVEEFNGVFSKCDVIVTPASPSTAYKLGEKTSNPVEMYANDICTVTVNIAGLPAMSIPCGFDGSGLPVGMQLIGPKFSEQQLLTAAKCYETAVGGFAVKEDLA